MTVTELLERLRVIRGQRLCLTRRSLDVRQFHFGSLTVDGRKRWGQWALHVACPWRVDGPAGLITGSSDSSHPREALRNEATAAVERLSVQDEALARIMESESQSFGEATNRGEALIVESIVVDNGMTLKLTFSGHYTLTVMPAGVRDEAWRFLQPDGDEEQLVVVGDHLDDRA